MVTEIICIVIAPTPSDTRYVIQSWQVSVILLNLQISNHAWLRHCIVTIYFNMSS